MQYKEVSKSTRKSHSDLFVLECLKQGLRPSKICTKFGINKKTLQYRLSTLKAQGIIKKIGYGVWEVVEQKEVSKSTQVASNQLVKSSDLFKQDSVRGHAFMFHFELPQNLRNWEGRVELLTQAGIPFKQLRIFGGGQQLIFKNRKIWLTDRSIIIYEKESFMAELASESQSKAISHFIGLLRSLERHLQANFEISRSRFKVSRQHYALIKNALAKQYDDEGEKLACYTGEGLWFLIDNSFNLHEAETVHPKTGVPDNKKVQDFFNGIKAYEGFTPQFLMQTVGGVAANQELYARNIESHIKAIQDLGAGVNQYNQGIAKLLDAIQELKK